jgi:hypothetical protein
MTGGIVATVAAPVFDVLSLRVVTSAVPRTALDTRAPTIPPTRAGRVHDRFAAAPSVAVVAAIGAAPTGASERGELPRAGVSKRRVVSGSAIDAAGVVALRGEVDQAESAGRAGVVVAVDGDDPIEGVDWVEVDDDDGEDDEDDGDGEDGDDGEDGVVSIDTS